MILPHTVTLYNIGEEDPTTYSRDVNITILRGVLLDVRRSNSQGTTGAANGDIATLHIPYGIVATDAITGETKAFASPKTYHGSETPSSLWTLELKNCFFVKGEVVNTNGDFQRINKENDDVFRVTDVSLKDYGNLQHWEVTGS